MHVVGPTTVDNRFWLVLQVYWSIIARLWDTDYCHTIEISDLDWLMVNSRDLLAFLCFWGSFVMWLRNESCASTVYSTGIA